MLLGGSESRLILKIRMHVLEPDSDLDSSIFECQYSSYDQQFDGSCEGR
jgi:hypothetical protein